MLSASHSFRDTNKKLNVKYASFIEKMNQFDTYRERIVKNKPNLGGVLIMNFIFLNYCKSKIKKGIPITEKQKLEKLITLITANFRSN